MSDPFVMDLFGGLPKTATYASETSTGATTVHENRGGRETLSSDRETRLSSDPQKEMQHSRGANLDFDKTDKSALSAPFSAMKGHTSLRSLSDRLTLSLISAGLVCGITPSSTRKQSGQPILVLAFDMPAGAGAASRPKDSSSLNGGRRERGHK